MIMEKQYNWVVVLCDYHAVKFDSIYSVSQTIKEALKDKAGCISCKLDMPANIQKLDVVLIDEEHQ